MDVWALRLTTCCFIIAEASSRCDSMHLLNLNNQSLKITNQRIIIPGRSATRTPEEPEYTNSASKQQKTSKQELEGMSSVVRDIIRKRISSKNLSLPLLCPFILPQVKVI